MLKRGIVPQCLNEFGRILNPSASTHFLIHNTALMRFPRILFNQATSLKTHELSFCSLIVSLQIQILELAIKCFMLHLLAA